MDLIRDEFLLQMLKTGKAYGHEIRSIAEELIKRRNGERVEEEEEDLNTDIIRLEFSGIQLAQQTYRTPTASGLAYMQPKETQFIKFQPNSRVLNCIVYCVSTK